MKKSLSPSARDRRNAALAVILDAPVFPNCSALCTTIRTNPASVNFQRLLDAGHWCTGEQLVLEAAAHVAGEKVYGARYTPDFEMLRTRLDHDNYLAILNGMVKVGSRRAMAAARIEAAFSDDDDVF